MFSKSNPKYVTAGISIELPLTLQMLIWELIENLGEVAELDYLQIFELSIVNDKYGALQKIVHKQECPEYDKTYMVNSSNPVRLKVYVIDDGPHATMLLAEEY